MSTIAAAPPPTARDHYSAVAVALHWLIALLIIANVLIGIAFKYHVAGAFPLHQSIGLTVLGLSVLRVIWRLGHPWLPLPATMPGWEKAAAISTFVAFYFLILAIPLLGWAAVSAHARGTSEWFGVAVPKLPVAQDHETGEQLGNLHMFLAWSAVALVVLHVAGAIKNSYLQKNHELTRMIPGLKTPDA